VAMFQQRKVRKHAVQKEGWGKKGPKTLEGDVLSRGRKSDFRHIASGMSRSGEGKITYEIARLRENLSRNDYKTWK